MYNKHPSRRVLRKLFSWTSESESVSDYGLTSVPSVPTASADVSDSAAASVPTASAEVASGWERPEALINLPNPEWDDDDGHKKEEEERKQWEWPDGGVCDLLKPAWEADCKKEEEERKQWEWPVWGVCHLLKPEWEAEACSPQQPQEKRARLCHAAAPAKAPPAAGGFAPTARKSPHVPAPIAAGLATASAKTPGVLLAAMCQHPCIHFSLLASQHIREEAVRFINRQRCSFARTMYFKFGITHDPVERFDAFHGAYGPLGFHRMDVIFAADNTHKTAELEIYLISHYKSQPQAIASRCLNINPGGETAGTRVPHYVYVAWQRRIPRAPIRHSTAKPEKRARPIITNLFED